MQPPSRQSEDTDTPAVPEHRWRLRPGLRGRILGWYVVLLTAASLASVVVGRQLLIAQVDTRIDDQLAQEVEELRALADVGFDPETGEPFGQDVARLFEVFLQRNRPLENEALLTFIDGEPYLRSRQVVPYRLDRDEELVARWGGTDTPERGRVETPAGTVAFQAVPVNLQGGVAGTFVVAIFRAPEIAEVDGAVRMAGIAALLTLLTGSVLAWQLAERLLRPVRRMTETARSIGESDLSQRLEIDQEDELGELARTFNEMLGRLEEAFRTQRRFVDDAGHELRTPLTAVRGHLEVMDEGAAAREETLPIVFDELDRMGRIVDDMLLLAKAERPDFLRLAEVDTGTLVESVRTKVAPLGDRDWRVEVAGSTRIEADVQRLTQALVQLVQNATAHTDTGDRITIGTDTGSGPDDDLVVHLWVDDTGRGIPAEQHEVIFERFRRGEGRRRSDGAGLGLSIVRAIAEAHGGTVTVDSTPGEGARFTITLPAMAGPTTGDAT